MIQCFGPPSKKGMNHSQGVSPKNPSLTCLLKHAAEQINTCARDKFHQMSQETYRCNLTPHKTVHFSKEGHHKKTCTTIPTIVWLRHSYIPGATNLLWRVKKHRDAQCNGTPPSHRILEEHPCQHEGSTFSPELLVMGAVSESVRKMYPKSTLNFPKRNVVLDKKVQNLKHIFWDWYWTRGWRRRMTGNTRKSA